MIVNIRGTNGSGKSTLARSFISPDKISHKELITLPSDKSTVINYSKEGVAVVGPYDDKTTGGCDRISTKVDTMAAVKYAAKSADIVIFEGIIVSTVYSTWLDFSKEIKSEGGEFIWVYLGTPLNTCINRIYDRNGFKKINEFLVKDKFKSIARTKDKALDAGETVISLEPLAPVFHLRKVLSL